MAAAPLETPVPKALLPPLKALNTAPPTTAPPKTGAETAPAIPPNANLKGSSATL